VVPGVTKGRLKLVWKF